MKTMRQLSLVKGDHRYVFRYQAGREADIIATFASMASDPGKDFDWFDAAVLSYQIGRGLNDTKQSGSAADKASRPAPRKLGGQQRSEG